jgi:DNA-nicking Smr family endonuclease
MAGNHELTEEEKRLWKQLNEQTRPLKKTPPQPEESKQAASRAKRAGPEAAVKIKRSVMIAPQQKIRPPEPERRPGHYANIDRNTAERFRKGKYPIDATLDLHGMTEVKAHEALMRFIHAAVKRGDRCLLVVTGKGTRGEGVLKRSLPYWLGDDAIAPNILTFDGAKAKDGGSGAWYILLKRQRT